MLLYKNRLCLVKFYLLIKRGEAFIERACGLQGDINGVPRKDRNPLQSISLGQVLLHDLLPVESSCFLPAFDFAATPETSGESWNGWGISLSCLLTLQFLTCSPRICVKYIYQQIISSPCLQKSVHPLTSWWRYTWGSIQLWFLLLK